MRGGTATPRPGKRTPNVSDNASEEDARAENVSIMDELTSQVRKADTAVEEYQRQLNILQTRLDDSLSYQAKLEDQVVEAKGKIEELDKDFASESRQRREIEGCFEAERAAFISDISEQKAREAELESTILRLKESLSQRELRAAFDEENGSLRSRKYSCGQMRTSNFSRFNSHLQRQIISRHCERSVRSATNSFAV